MVGGPQVRPPERATLKRKLKPPLQAYVCYLLQEVLTTDTVQLVRLSRIQNLLGSLVG